MEKIRVGITVLLLLVGVSWDGLLFSVERKYTEANSSQLQNKFEQDGWDVKSLDTARKVNYLSNAEKDVILASNAVRTNPKKFGKLYVLPITKKFKGKLFVKSNGVYIRTQEGVRAVHELYNYLRRRDGISIQQPSKGISRAAAGHAAEQSKTGKTGHYGNNGSSPFERMNRYGRWQGFAGENISYGNKDGLSIVLQLLIDDGMPSRGHRKNIFNSDFHKVGVGIDSHSKYKNVCVIDYATDYIEK